MNNPFKTIVYFAAVLTLGVTLPGCSKEGGYPPPGLAQAASNAKQAAGIDKGAATTGLRIITWGPESTAVGEAFNVQPDGHAALWIRVNQSMDGSASVITMDGKPLQSAISGRLITAFVPPGIYARAGVHALHVTMKNGVVSVESNDVKFVVH